MNLKNTPKPWQICVEIAISFGLTVGIAEIADLLWSAIGGGFKLFAVIVLMAIAFVIIAIYIDRIARKRDLVSPVYLDVFKGCLGMVLFLFIIFAIDYSVHQARYIKDFKERQAEKASIIVTPDFPADSLLYEDSIFPDFYTSHFDYYPSWGSYDPETNEYSNQIDLSDYFLSGYEEVEGSRHFCVIVPNDPVMLEWTSGRLKRFADFATGKDIPYCPIIRSREQMCSYYYYASGGDEFTPVPEKPEIFEQYAIFLGSAMITEEYFTMEENTWYDNYSCGNKEKTSWFTMNRETGKELSLYDIIDKQHRKDFNKLLIQHLCNADGYWKDTHNWEQESICNQFNGVALVPEGVVVYYHPYQIGCGAEGQFNSLIPYAELEGMLKCKIDD